MKRMILLLILFCFCFTVQSFAGEKKHRKLAEKVLKLFKADEKVTATIDRIVNSQNKQLEDILAPKAAFDVQKKISKIYEETMNWKNTKEEYVDLYVKNFTEKELKDIIDFYSSETGKKLLEKQDEIAQKGMDIGEKKIEAALPKIQQLIRDEAEKSKGGQEGYKDFPKPEAPKK